MHFFYLDETGCTGVDLKNPEQPIFVLGGISVSDDRWRTTTDEIEKAVSAFFNGAVPPNFELHANELINRTGPFDGKTQAECNAFALKLLDIVVTLKHKTHFIAIDKKRLLEHAEGNEHDIIDCKAPYLLGFNYLVTYIERYVKDKLGKSARGMIILDEKKMYQADVDKLTHFRRFDVPNVRKIKWLVEFSHPVDSVRHPLIQISDLVIYSARKFLECDNGYRPDWPVEAKNFFASCYDRVDQRVWRSTLIDSPGEEEEGAHELLKLCQSTHQGHWKNNYALS
jgi:Protein of unknown function (DUF3800)